MKNVELSTVHALLNHAVDSFSNENYQASLTTVIQAVNAAQQLRPRNHELEFRVFFYKMINHAMLLQWPLAFASSLQCIHIMENHQLMMDVEPKDMALCYFGCADAAMHLPSLAESALIIHEKGVRWCQESAPEFLLLAHHLKAKLLLGQKRFEDALSIAEQTLAQKELRPASFGCPLSCYHVVYIEALYWAKQPEAALSYVDQVVLRSPDIALLWFAKAKLHFRACHYELTLLACKQALLVRASDTESALLCAQAHMLLQQKKEALSILRAAHVYRPDDLMMSLWLFLLGGEQMSALSKNLPTKQWLPSVCSFVLNQISLPQLLAFAKEQDNSEDCLGQSYCFAALQSSEKTGKKYYKYCLQHSALNSPEALWASACLETDLAF